MSFRVGDLVEAGGCAGKVLSVRGTSVEVELNDRPGERFWYKAADVKLGSPPPRPTLMAARYSGGEARVEVRPICEHLRLAEEGTECGDRREKNEPREIAVY